MITITVDETQARLRADKLVASLHPQYPRAALQKLFESGHITLNDNPAKVGAKVRPGDRITIDLSPLEAVPEAIELPVLYEDPNVLVINKPVGIISHARGRYFNEPSVASFVRQRVAGLTGERAGIVHRLDRATSGVMITAKNPIALSWLQKQFSARRVGKEYLAVITGQMPTPEGLIDMPIERNPNKPQTFHTGPNGKAARTRYSTEAVYEHRSLIKLQPETGRTHQLRVHLKALGHPICGDELYGGDPAGRLLLHAASLEITLPGGRRQQFNAPLPDAFNKELI